MIEVRIVTDAVLEIARRCDAIKAEMDLERRQGLEADWSAVAEMLDGIGSLAIPASNAAWTVFHEGSAE